MKKKSKPWSKNISSADWERLDVLFEETFNSYDRSDGTRFNVGFFTDEFLNKYGQWLMDHIHDLRDNPYESDPYDPYSGYSKNLYDSSNKRYWQLVHDLIEERKDYYLAKQVKLVKVKKKSTTDKFLLNKKAFLNGSIKWESYESLMSKQSKKKTKKKKVKKVKQSAELNYWRQFLDEEEAKAMVAKVAETKVKEAKVKAKEKRKKLKAKLIEAAKPLPGFDSGIWSQRALDI